MSALIASRAAFLSSFTLAIAASFSSFVAALLPLIFSICAVAVCVTASIAGCLLRFTITV